MAESAPADVLLDCMGEVWELHRPFLQKSHVLSKLLKAADYEEERRCYLYLFLDASNLSLQAVFRSVLAYEDVVVFLHLYECVDILSWVLSSVYMLICSSFLTDL